MTLGVARTESPWRLTLVNTNTSSASAPSGEETSVAAFLDQWKIPHVNGSIEVDDYPAPNEAQVREAVAAVEQPKEDVRLYLAAAGLLMGDDWRAATWPVVDEMASGELAKE